jgi:MYXO-CTERM domain-containing protein
MRFRNFGRVATRTLLLGVVTRPALAQVMQPTGEVMPTPTPEAELQVIRDRGFMDDAVTLEGLFTYRGEMIDPVMDAKTAPGAFSPLCGFTGELVLRGAGCKVALGWYNVTGQRPAANEIYELVPADPTAPVARNGLACQDQDFCPLATMNTTQTGQHQWTPRTYPAANIRMDMRYRGGQVGFALIGATGTNCSQTKFSEAELNDKSPSGAPWVTTLIWQSTLTPDAYYIGFEDLPTSPTTWKGQGGAFVNDGDFNDFVFYVTGLTCKGAGQACTTNLQGACAAGLTDCAEDGTTPACRPVVQPSSERCDNVDNDCDGTVDDDAPCPDGKKCFQGKCVASCSTGEFQCPNTFSCNDAGLCIDLACQSVTCADGEVCIGGNCRSACQDVKCPIGQECQLGRCVDLCAGVMCDAEKVCERGICVNHCGCRTCPADQACAMGGESDGKCVDAGCEGKTCDVGQVCRGGGCVNACDGAVCPGNALCTAGNCEEPSVGSVPGAGPGATAGSGGMISIPINPTGSGGSGTGVVPPTPGTTSGTGSTETVRGRRGRPQPDSGCIISVAAGSPATPVGLGALALAALALRRRSGSLRGWLRDAARRAKSSGPE